MDLNDWESWTKCYWYLSHLFQNMEQYLFILLTVPTISLTANYACNKKLIGSINISLHVCEQY